MILADMRVLKGLPASPGVAFGYAVSYQPAGAPVQRSGVDSSAAQELQRLSTALEQAREQLVVLERQARDLAGEQAAQVIADHQLFLEDPELIGDARRRIKRGEGAEDAVNHAFGKYIRKLRALRVEPFVQRVADLEDVSLRLRRILARAENNNGQHSVGTQTIVLAQDLTPSEILRFLQRGAKAFCAVRGGVSSHAAIIARSAGTPSVLAIGKALLDIADGERVLVDGDIGLVIVRPDAATMARYADALARSSATLVTTNEVDQSLVCTMDGRQIAVEANIGDESSARLAVSNGADGVGLFRTEYLFLSRPAAPDEEEQYQSYTNVLDIMQGRPVTIRTVDIGGDKQVSYLENGTESNPALGCRGTHLALARPELFEPQLRAIVRASAGHRLRVVFPMVTTVEEVRAAKALLSEAQQMSRSEGSTTAERIEIGTMVEAPAAALIVDLLSREVDFFSIGTNDLVQYIMACERGNAALERLCDPFHPAVVRLIHQVVSEAHRAGKWVGLCGEMAGNPQAVPLLVGLSLDELSMSPALIPLVKARVRQLDFGALRHALDSALGCESADQVRQCFADQPGT